MFAKKFGPKMGNISSMKPGFVLFLFTGVLICTACQRKSPPEDTGVWKKIRLDFRQIDPEGLTGPAGGKVAVNYEFCIPAGNKFWKSVKKIDKTAQKQAGSAGRIGCNKSQWLIIGSTHQPNYLRVLYDLAALPYVEKIEQTFWE